MFWGKAMGTDGLTGGGKIKISRCYIWNLVKKSSWIWRMVPVSTLWFEWRTWQKCRTKAVRSVFLLISKNYTEGWDQINNITFSWRLCSDFMCATMHGPVPNNCISLKASIEPAHVISTAGTNYPWHCIQTPTLHQICQYQSHEAGTFPVLWNTLIQITRQSCNYK